MSADLEPSWRRTLSKIVLGLLLAVAVYLLMESLGFGTSRKERQIGFLLPQPGQVEVIYLSDDEIIRRATLPAPSSKAIDEAKLPAGRYELEIFLHYPDHSTTARRTIELGEPESITIDLRNN